MSEASRILVEEGAFGTIIDEEFVAALDQKWGPLLEGLPAKTPMDRKSRFITASSLDPSVWFQPSIRALRHRFSIRTQASQSLATVSYGRPRRKTGLPAVVFFASLFLVIGLLTDGAGRYAWRRVSMKYTARASLCAAATLAFFFPLRRTCRL